MAWNKVKKVRVANVATGKSEIVLLPMWVEKNGFNISSVRTAIYRGETYRGYKIEGVGYATVDREGSEITETSRNMLVNGYRSGMSVSQLAERFHLGYASTRTILEEAGYNYPLANRAKKAVTAYPDYDITDVGKLKALVAAGWNEKDIAYEFNTSVTKVREKMAEI